MVKDCPIAHTMGHTFSYTTSVHLQRDIVYLPTLYKIDKLLDDDTLSSTLEENTISCMDEMLTSGVSDIDNFEDEIPINTLINRIRSRLSRIVTWYLAILQHIVAVLATLYILYKLGLQFKEKLLPLTIKYLPTCIRRRPTRYNSVPVLQNVPLQRIPKPGGRGEVSRTAPLPPGTLLPPV